MALCQRGAASCGACCGLYNRADLARPRIEAELRRRTQALAGVPRRAEAFRAAAAALAAEAAPPLFPSVRVCPLLGFLDRDGTRVGCLAHPAATGGADLRDCGAYDARTCEAFLCPSHSFLSEEEADLSARATGDWYLYGLVVTDVPFLRACLEAVAAEAGARVERRTLAHPPFGEALRRLLALKEELEPGSEGIFGAFRTGPHGEDLPRAIDYQAIGRAPSRFDEILRCIGADPRSGNDLDALEEEVRRRVGACAGAWPPA
ncbi:MAG TPA: hypothetical protein VLS93_10600 [Anaeromyxobacteraceae bacterium]|nr:hypothetical protein [Anaeromyxobacteraceae bacterium]